MKLRLLSNTLGAGALAATLLASLPLTASAQATRAAAASPAERAAAAHPTRAFWADQRGALAAASARGTEPAVQALRYRALTVDRASLAVHLAAAPLERSDAARRTPLVLTLPAPDGRFERFRVVETAMMEPGLAARHPGIKTYAGTGIDDAGASLRITLSPLGVTASVRGSKGSWYIDPYYRADDSLHASYFRSDMPRRAPFAEAPLFGPQLGLSRGRTRAGDVLELRGAGFAPGAQVTIAVRQSASDRAPQQVLTTTADAEGVIATSFRAALSRAAGGYEVEVSDGSTTARSSYTVVADNEPLMASVGTQLRTYRLALLSDPAYASFFGGAANVTAAKVALMNRVSQIYEDETSIRLVLIANNDAVNLSTAAQFSGANGPCGATACYPTAAVSCSSATLTRTRTVIGLLIGASNFDIGHIIVGAGGGGIASLGVVGGSAKAQGCTGLPSPTGDAFAVDYVAHEMGHQFAGNHTFNSAVCGGNRSQANSVEPGSGSSIMAYAGICGSDDLQPNSDPYWSQRSFDEIVNYISTAETSLSELQQVALAGFTTTAQQFQLRLGGADSAPIVRGLNFTTTGIKAAVEAIPGWPAGGTVTIGSLTDAGFTISFGGTLAGVPVANLQLVGCTAPCTGFVGEIVAGGLTARGGNTIVATGNVPPAVSVPANATIPVRTPFALAGSGTDANGDTVTFMWEQTDRGGSSAAQLNTNTRTDGPLFRQFGTRQVVASAGIYNPPGQNAPTAADSTRVFPDLPQILINNTNAETGSCPTAGFTATQLNDCFSEFLPTAGYVGTAGVNAAPPSLGFRLTARDGQGGVNSADVRLTLAPNAGPFLVTAPNTAISVDAGRPLTVAWSVANTDVAPVSTANVRITLSTDGGLTYPFTLLASTPNDGSQAVSLPNVSTTQARIRVEAVGNYFFDVGNVNFTIRLAGDVDGDGLVNCTDAGIVRRAFGTSVGQPGYDPRADIDGNGSITTFDFRYVRNRLDPSLLCF